MASSWGPAGQASYRRRLAAEAAADRDCLPVPMVIATGRILNLADDADWSEYYKNCGRGILMCAKCRLEIYLRIDDKGQRSTAMFNPGGRRATEPESDLHKAVKSKIGDLAIRAGFEAKVEKPGEGHKFRTDVLVMGGPKPVGHEVQVSSIVHGDIRRRVNLAMGNGIVPAWSALSETSVATRIGGRAPLSLLASRVQLDYQGMGNTRVYALRGVRSRRCTFQDTKAPWHPKVCTGWHVNLEATPQPTLAEFVARTAGGEFVAMVHHRPYKRLMQSWIWLTSKAAAEMAAVEPDDMYPAPLPGNAAIDSRRVSKSKHAPGKGRPVPEQLTGWAAVVAAAPGRPCSRCGVTAAAHNPDEIGMCAKCAKNYTHRYGDKGNPICRTCAMGGAG